MNSADTATKQTPMQEELTRHNKKRLSNPSEFHPVRILSSAIYSASTWTKLCGD